MRIITCRWRSSSREEDLNDPHFRRSYVAKIVTQKNQQVD